EFEKMNTYRLYWRNIEIGQFFEETMDMGYVDGIVKINDSSQAKDFIVLASKLDLEIVMDNPLKGLRAVLMDEKEFVTNVLVLGLWENKNLSLKWIVGKDNIIDWFLKNVPE